LDDSLGPLHYLDFARPERVVTMHLAVPAGRRARLLRNATWAWCVQPRISGVAEALALVEQTIAETNGPWTPAGQAAAVIQFMSGPRQERHLSAIADADADGTWLGTRGVPMV
jgi:hypothetical protein